MIEPPYCRQFTSSLPAPTEHDRVDGTTKLPTNISFKPMDSNITLWQFLLELLVGNKHKEIIQWTNNEGEFKLVNPEEVASLWGRRKNKLNMNYDKLSRALRYYYEKNIIKKVMGQKFMYKFVSFPEIVKTETKIPFKQKMESMNLKPDCGQEVLRFPHFASYNAEKIKSSAENATGISLSKQDALGISIKQESFNFETSDSTQRTLSLTPVTTNYVPYTKITQTSTMPSSISPISSASFMNNTNMDSEHKALNLSFSSSASTVSVTKPKPNPLTLNVTPTVQTTITAATPVPILSPRLMPPQFPGIHTPFMLASPMLGFSRTPLPLHFWSSLSPITTISPGRLPTTTTAFQFPIDNRQLSLPNFSAIESLNSP